MSAIGKINDIGSLKRFSPLNELDYDKLSELIENSVVLQFKKGQPIVAGIEKNHSVYLLSGSVVRAPNSHQAQLIKAGSIQADQAIMSPGSRPRMVAENNVTVLCIDSELLDLLLNWGTEDGLVVDEIDADESNEWVDGLLQSETILSLSPQSIQTLMAVVEPVELNVDDIVFRQGDQPDYYYMISRGSCVVTRRNAEQGQPVELARLGAGDAFGEEALISNAERSATVRMIEAGMLLRLDQKNFKKLLEESLVNTITVEHAHALKARGAMMLDLRSAEAFSVDGSGVNIPFAELRSRMATLDRDKKYIVVSDDNNMSAVGAFLLSKKRFKVYVLKTAAKEEIAAKAAEVSIQAKELEGTVTQLQQRLDEVSSQLQQEAQSHTATKQRIHSLESSLHETEQNARKAILEASALKTRSESFLRNRINTLTGELEQEKLTSQNLKAANEKLESELESAQGRVEEILRNAETSSTQVDELTSEAKQREVELGEQIKELQQNLEELQQNNAALLSEKELLSSQLSAVGENSEHQGDELKRVHEQLQSVSEHARSLEHELESVQARYSELEARLAQSEEEKQALTEQLVEVNEKAEQQIENLRAQQAELEAGLAEAQEEKTSLSEQLNAVEQKSEQQAVEIDDLQMQLLKRNEKIVQTEQELEELQAQQSDLEACLAQTQEEKVLLSEQLNTVENKSEQQSAEIDDLQQQLQNRNETIEQAGQDLEALQARHSELESDLARELEEKASLVTQLEKSEHTAEQRAAELDELQQQLRSTTDRADQAEEKLAATQEQLAETEESLELSRQVGHQAKQQLKQQEKLTAEQERKIALLNEEAHIQAHEAQQQQVALQQQIDAMEANLAAKKASYLQAESGFKQQIGQLNSELNGARTEARQLSDQLSKQELRNKVLSEELSRLQDENRRSGTMVKGLFLVLLLLVGAIAWAYQMGIDLHGETSALLEEAAPQINQIIDTIPEKLSNLQR